MTSTVAALNQRQLVVSSFEIFSQKIENMYNEHCTKLILFLSLSFVTEMKSVFLRIPNKCCFSGGNLS